jgi:ubiquinone/menaquinone biosynthesis C-methylase UbiE
VNAQTTNVLCIGCGALPEGDVNVDAFPSDRSQCSHDWNPRKTRNFVLADAAHLPFRDKAFSEVRARHCLEHLHAPVSAVKEWSRVCYGKVRVWVPSQWKRDHMSAHLYALSPVELANLFRLVFQRVHVDYTGRVYRFTERHHVKTIVVNLIVRLFGFYTEIYAEGVCQV